MNPKKHEQSFMSYELAARKLGKQQAITVTGNDITFLVQECHRNHEAAGKRGAQIFQIHVPILTQKCRHPWITQAVQKVLDAQVLQKHGYTNTHYCNDILIRLYQPPQP